MNTNDFLKRLEMMTYDDANKAGYRRANRDLLEAFNKLEDALDILHFMNKNTGVETEELFETLHNLMWGLTDLHGELDMQEIAYNDPYR